MKLITTATLTAAAVLLSGCAVYPAGPVSGGVYYDDPGYYRNSPGPLYYDQGTYIGPPSVYYSPAPVIINQGGYRGNWDRDRRGDRDRFDRDGRDGRGPRPGDGRPQGRPPQAQPPQGQPQVQQPRPPRPSRPQQQEPSGSNSGLGNSDNLRLPGAFGGGR